jgi:hypothetical protein
VCRTNHGERGAALVLAIMTLLLMTALGTALVVTTISETMIAANFGAATAAFYAADAAIERAFGDLRAAPDWNLALGGASQSAFADGPPNGLRTLADGTVLDLTKIVNVANCNREDACNESEMDAVSADRPWGANNPRWRLYAYGRLSEMVPVVSIASPFYVLAMVADDPSENDGDPGVDGDGEGNPGAGVILLRAEAFGPRGAHRVVEATIARQPAVRLLSWRERR